MLFVANDSPLSMVTILPRSSGLSGQRHWLDSGMAWLPLVNLLNLNPESELFPCPANDKSTSTRWTT